MDNPTRGIALILGATLLFSISDVMAKVLGAHVPVIEIGWIRYCVFALLIVGGSFRQGGRWQKRLRLKVASPAMQVVRGVMLVASMLLFILALRFMPIADAAAVGFVSPLLITLLSIPLLGEVVGLRRWTAIVIGFIGVLIIIRPGTGAFQPAALLVVGSSLAWAFASVMTRKMSATENPSATLLWSAFVGLGLLSMMVPFVFVPLAPWQFALNLALGSVATGGQYLMVRAYQYAGASLLAPFSYIQILWATIAGYLVFGALPDRMTLVGAAIITASGLYTIHRERVRARTQQARLA
jgi:drug/metabolite transporter (DMT)-like permease